MSADEKAKDLEYELFVALRETVHAAARRLQSHGRVAGPAGCAGRPGRTRVAAALRPPVLVDEPVLKIIDGRHPVLDILEPQGTFVPNDTVADAQAA